MIDTLEGVPADQVPTTYVPWIFVDDLDAHLARARENGATIAEEISSHGFTSYIALDLESRPWRFAKARPTQPTAP
jgi:predicted enzyme related to lactoylglutathione lyase